MVTQEEFQKAQKIIEEYKIQSYKILITNRICICCKTKEISPLESMGLSDGLIKPTEQEQGCWNSGTVEKVTFGYGSRHDMRTFYIAICDDCIEQLETNNLITDFKIIRKEEREYGF